METALLKGFAVKARVDLLGEVGARLDVVLAPGSSERVERPGVVVALERVVELEGRDAVIDRVAYTWFNRLVAFRFMDVNGFTRVGVVSPEAGKLTGQPQVLADAKGGDFEVDVVSVKTQAAVTALLNGTRLSVDAQGEAYGLLVEAYCRFWNKVMPFMFEREGDFTELLLPTDLLAANSVRSRAVQVLTEDVCKDVEVIGWLYQFYISERKDEVFAGFKKGKKAGAAEIPAATQLFTPDWIVRYLVENSLGRLWMLNHPDSHLVDQMDYYIAPVDEETDFLKISSPQEIKIIDPACGSGHMLTYAFDLLYAIYLEESYAPSEIPGLILANNLYGIEIDPRAGALAAFALAMKARARQSTFFAKDSQPNICVLQNVHFTAVELDELITLGGDRFAEEDFWQSFENADTFGSLIQPDKKLLPSLRMHVDHVTKTDQLFTQDLYTRAETVLTQSQYLSQRYHVVVANPPYMGSKQMDAQLRLHIEKTWSSAKNDLATGFIAAGIDILERGGLLAMVCPQSWMFLSRYEEFRKQVFNSSPPTGLAHLGPHAFPEIAGEVVQVAAMILEKGREPALSRRAVYLRLVEFPDAGAKRDALMRAASLKSPEITYIKSLEEVHRIPGSPLAYWASSEILTSFADGTPLGDVAATRKGMVTARNDEFLRFWFEVSNSRSALDDCQSREEALNSAKRWFGYIKGGQARRWFGNYIYVVDWENDGGRLQTERHPSENRVWATNFNLEYIFRKNVNWGDISGAGLTARWCDGGMLFDGKGPACFPPDERGMEILALLNSPVAAYVMQLLNPTLNFLVGDVARIPLADVDRGRVNALTSDAIALARSDWNESELSWSFGENPLIEQSDWSQRLENTCFSYAKTRNSARDHLERVENELAAIFAEAYGVTDAVDEESRVQTIQVEPITATLGQLISYAVGCMFGRYSPDLPGLILADQGGMLQDYLAKVSDPSFMPDADNVIPIVDGDWFEDDVVGKFRQFLRVAFGEEHFEENLKFVVDSLGVKNLREYFVKSFYKDHVQRYKKRPIYWLFSSPKGSFNALIYLHRYNSSTVSTVLNDYLREYIKKLEVSLEQQERIVAGGSGAREVSVAQKESDRLRKVLIELADYERDLYALASHQIALDLDDGVLVNYQKFGKALKDIGLKKGAADE